MATTGPQGAIRRRAPRVDAIRNREVILDVASEAMASQGAAVDAREIARLSGVGMGTLYRHFPKKEDLVQTVLRRDFSGWAESARQAAVGAEDPWAALTDFYQQALTGYARHRVIVEHFALTWSEPDLEGIQQLRLALEQLRARATEQLRPGVTTDDLLLLLVSLGHAVQITDKCRPQMWNRLLRISLDGLRADHREPLPAGNPDQASLLTRGEVVTQEREQVALPHLISASTSRVHHTDPLRGHSPAEGLADARPARDPWSSVARPRPADLRKRLLDALLHSRRLSATSFRSGVIEPPIPQPRRCAHRSRGATS